MRFLGRVWLYLGERQPLPTTILFPTTYFYCVFSFYSVITQSYIFPPLSLWYVLVTAILFNMTFWVNDDIKDELFDRTHNPQRAVVRGAVKYSDLKLLSLISFIVMIAINFDRGFITSVFLIWLSILAFWLHSYYFPEILEKHYPLSISTGGHPMLIVGNIYFFEAFRATSPDIVVPIPVVIVISVVFALPVFAWEIARKTRAIEEETEFPTYSLKWGTLRAILVPIIYYIISSSLLASLGFIFNFSVYFIIAELLLGLFVIILFLRFLLKPNAQRNVLKRASETYDIMSKLAVIAELATLAATRGA